MNHKRSKYAIHVPLDRREPWKQTHFLCVQNIGNSSIRNSRCNQWKCPYLDSCPLYRFPFVWSVQWWWLEAPRTQTSAMMSSCRNDFIKWPWQPSACFTLYQLVRVSILCWSSRVLDDALTEIPSENMLLLQGCSTNHINSINLRETLSVRWLRSVIDPFH